MTAREANDKGYRIGNHSFVKPENFDLNVGSNYARIKAEDKIWEGLGFVLQWAKYGLKK